jgi:hypothetical protein
MGKMGHRRVENGLEGHQSQLQPLGDAWNDRGEEEKVFSMVIEEFPKQEGDMMSWLHVISPAGYLLL